MDKINQNSFNIMIGKSVKDYRKKLNLSRYELAIKCQVNEKYLGKIERGECSASAFILKKISTGLNIQLSDIINGL